MLRRFLAGAALSALLLTGCGQDQDATVEIGAVTIVSHPSLDAIYEGFTEGLAEAGYVEGKNLKLDFQNPQGDQQTLANITSAFASSSGSVCCPSAGASSPSPGSIRRSCCFLPR